MRRVAVSVLVAGVLGPAAVAWADEEITASPVNRFDNPNVTIDQGERLTFRNNDVRAHDVTSERPGEFASATIGNNQTAFVEGSQYLTSGTYPFLCSIHPEMKGTLTVTTAGAPVPRPGSGGPPPADTTDPSIKVEINGAVPRASALKQSGKLKLKVSSSEAATMRLTGKLGSLRAVSLTREVTAADDVPFTVRIPAAARKRLKRGSRLRFSYSVKDTAGNTGSGTLLIRLR